MIIIIIIEINNYKFEEKILFRVEKTYLMTKIIK